MMGTERPEMDAIQWLRYGYLGAAYGVILIAIVPSFRSRFLAYGARVSEEAFEKKKADEEDGKDEKNTAPSKESEKTSSNPLTWTLDTIASITVPHDWFLSFYFLSLSLCAFWPGEALYLRGPLWRLVKMFTKPQASSMTFSQLQTTWAMMFIQSGRRLYECLALPSSSESSMFIGHWLMGMAFYATMSVAIWIEGIPTIQSHTLSFYDLTILAPSFRTLLSTILFILASGIQRDCHAYLAHLKTPAAAKTKPEEEHTPLKTYRLPDHPAFQPLFCPHYTAECVIYLAMAINAAPPGEWLNRTLGSALVFVFVNLGITAYGTKEWYERVFGKAAVQGKWRMIPFLY